MSNAKADKGITVIGAEWCHDTAATLKLLDRLGVAYTYVDIDDDPAAGEFITKLNHGKRLTPTVDLGDGQYLFEPSDEVMTTMLLEKGLA